MTKIMLVEDDNNLREIYEARLLAEGYEIVSATDGEQALTFAVREHPDLIICDVMMPKISGFDMLDIIRNTPEIKNTKVIMMTALSQAEDKARADKLGADRYLVKSQVTLEDVAKVAKEVLTSAAPTPLTAASMEESASSAFTPGLQPGQTLSGANPAATATSPIQTATPAVDQPDLPASPEDLAAMEKQISTVIDQKPTSAPANVDQAVEQAAKALNGEAPQSDSDTTVVTSESAPNNKSSSDATSVAADNATKLVDAVNKAFNNSPPEKPETTTESTATPTVAATAAPQPNSTGSKRVIQPISDISTGPPNLNELLAKEQAKEAALQPEIIPPFQDISPAATTTPANQTVPTIPIAVQEASSENPIQPAV